MHKIKKQLDVKCRQNVEMSLEYKLCKTKTCKHNYVWSNLHCITLIFNTVPLVQSIFQVVRYIYLYESYIILRLYRITYLCIGNIQSVFSLIN